MPLFVLKNGNWVQIPRERTYLLDKGVNTWRSTREIKYTTQVPLNSGYRKDYANRNINPMGGNGRMTSIYPNPPVSSVEVLPGSWRITNGWRRMFPEQGGNMRIPSGLWGRHTMRGTLNIPNRLRKLIGMRLQFRSWNRNETFVSVVNGSTGAMSVEQDVPRNNQIVPYYFDLSGLDIQPWHAVEIQIRSIGDQGDARHFADGNVTELFWAN